MKRFMLALVLMMLAGCAPTFKEGDVPVIKPDEMGKFEYESNTVRYNSPEFTVEASYLNPDQVGLYFSVFKGGKYRNPFPASYAVFQIAITNKSKSTLTYDPRMAVLYPEKGYPIQSKDFASLYMELKLAGADDLEGRMRAYNASCFDGETRVRPGGKVQKLMAFARGQEPLRKARLVLENMRVGYEARSVPIFFGEGSGLN